MALTDTARLVVELMLAGNYVRGLRDASRETGRFEGNFGRTQRSMSTFGRNMERAAVIGAGAFATAVVGSVKAASDFEASLNTINTIAREESPEALKAIGDGIRQVARDTGAPLASLTEGYYDLLSAGIDAAHAQDVLTAANTLAIGGLSTSAEAVDLLTTSINTYGGDATRAAAHTDIFAKAVERGKVTAAELASSFATVGPLAASQGIEIEELAAGYARLTAGGTAAGEAATQMSSAITAFIKKSGPLKALEKQTGRNYAAIASRQGLAVAYQQLRTDAEKAGVELGTLLGRKEALLYALQVTGPNQRAYNQDLLAMGDAAGTAAAQMAERQQGLNFQLSRLKALALDAGITIGQALLPKLTPLVGKFADFLSKNQGQIEQFGSDLANAFEEIGEAAQDIPWGTIKDGLSTSFAIAKEAVGLFRSLPPGLQQAAIAALAVNKVTGGLASSVIKDILGLGLKGLRTIVAGNVTVIGKNVIGGGGPGVGGRGGRGGGIPGAAKGAAAAGLGLGGAAIGSLVAAALAPAFVFGITKALVEASGTTIPEADRRGRQATAAARGIPGRVPAERPHRAPTDPRLIQAAQRTAFHTNVTNERLSSIRASEARAIDAASRGERAAIGRAAAQQTAAVRRHQATTDRASHNEIRVTNIAASQQRAAVSRAAARAAADAGRVAGRVQGVIGKLGTLPPAIRAIEHPVTAKVAVQTHSSLSVDGRVVASAVSRYLRPGRTFVS